MEKIPTYLERDWEGDRSRVLDQVHEGCEWVLAGEGVSTRKYDGTCVMYDGERWWARRDVREGKPTPDGFVATGETDPETGKTPGWEPIEQSPFAKFHEEAVAAVREEDSGIPFPVGTYELLGPKVQGNPEKTEGHKLLLHSGADVLTVEDRSYEGIRQALEGLDVEGIVFHHPDGRRAKIKKRDFGLKRD